MNVLRTKRYTYECIHINVYGVSFMTMHNTNTEKILIPVTNLLFMILTINLIHICVSTDSTK